MKKIVRLKDSSTQIFIGEDALSYIDRYLSLLKFSSVVFVIDENSKQYTLPLLQKFFTLASDKTTTGATITINGTEQHKNINTVVSLWKKFEELNLDRNSIIINVGGGVVSDMAGFAAATYKRGIRFINIPTTLLSMVDASVGGKTGIDLDNLKNAVGVFARPLAVFISPLFLQTLQRKELLSGMAEVIKMYAISGKGLLSVNPTEGDRMPLKTQRLRRANRVKRSYLMDNEYLRDEAQRIDLRNLEASIVFAVKEKARIARKDFHEKSLRKTLNFGHTFGHAFESLLLEKNTAVTHGEAVLWGMVCELWLSVKLLGFPAKEYNKFLEFARKNYNTLPLSTEDIPALINYMQGDKKNTNGKIYPVLLKKYGCCVYNIAIDKDIITDCLIEFLAY
ncbi:MAG: 3-dehydroquinate synthase [Bacteroidales bacterium]|jgi:3-dehydroquinate synthase|nr:3-dehydroquinate synthase [Bacteroidales bacterium]